MLAIKKELFKESKLIKLSLSKHRTNAKRKGLGKYSIEACTKLKY